ncbi:hypothetical protein C8K36_1011267 [Rhodococcus sp. OK519]|uniref:hypothetical protein n=1 Tax=Rhodococcus sp. OK519 TaxID=2135729 RepID=UPI000D340A4C|nr:hypothetical protein C8K36_1011267 [Rhodococcus sp. OK519]
MGILTRAAIAGAAIAVAGGLVACGSSSEQAAPSESSEPAALGPVVTAPSDPADGPITDSAALRAALLTASDLPAGFVALPAATDANDPAAGADATQSATNPTRCANVLDTITRQAAGSAADAEANFTGPGFTSIDVDAASYPGAGAADAFGTVQTTLRQCTVYTGTDGEGVAVDYRVEPLALPTVGDASTAVRLVTTSDGFTLVSDAAIAVVDSTVVQVVATGPDPIDSAVLEGLARSATERIHAAAPSR